MKALEADVCLPQSCISYHWPMVLQGVPVDLSTYEGRAELMSKVKL